MLAPFSHLSAFEYVKTVSSVDVDQDFSFSLWTPGWQFCRFIQDKIFNEVIVFCT